jgi:competence protein ComEC
MGGQPRVAQQGHRRVAMWALAAGAGWLLGTVAQLQRPGVDGDRALLACAVAGVVLAALAWACGHGRRSWSSVLLATAVLLAAALLGFVATTWRAVERIETLTLAPEFEGRDLLLRGTVVSLPREGAAAVRFVFELEAARSGGEPIRVPKRLQLAWYAGRGAADGLEETAADADVRPHAGERWELTVRLRRPHGAQNPHGFDFELWLWEQQIGATGYVRTNRDAQNRRLETSAWSAPVQQLRETLRERIRAQVGDAGAAGVVAALVVGDQAAIEREDWTLFRAAGIQHLMAISGLHITMLAWLGAALGGWLWRRVPGGGGRWMLWLPAPLAARWIGLLLALAYAVLAGWGVPAQRTVWMLAVVVLLRSLGLAWPMLAVLGAAGWVVVALDPWALLQPGFWLSFVAVGLLVVAEPAAAQAAHEPDLPGARTHLRRLRDAALAGLRTQAVATVGLAPLTLLFFHQLSVIGFVANLVAIPWVTLVVTPLALAGMLLPPLWALAGWAVQGLLVLLAPLAAWPQALWHAAAAPTALLVLGLAGGAVAVLPLPWRLRACGVLMALPLLAPPVVRPPLGRFEAVVLDVGQGTAVFVRTAGHLLVYDAGPQYSAESEAGSRILVPLLRARGEARIDHLVLSHRDSDHTGGAAALLAALPVRALSSSLEATHPLLADAQQRGMAPVRCEAGQRWRWDGVEFELLHPRAEHYPAFDAVPPRANALSCVLRVSDGTRSLLLSGDAEAAQEASMLAGQAAGTELASTVLVAPHHGSKTSSTPAFLDAVKPELALFQAGYRSRFGHPAPEVVQRYDERRIAVVRSDRCGAWIWRSDAPPQAGVCERLVSRRYWHHPAALEQGLSGQPKEP